MHNIIFAVMKIIKTITILLLFVFGISNNGVGQNKKNENIFYDADALYSFQQYDKAVLLFLQIEDSISQSIIPRSELLYRIAFCYYNSSLDKEKCIPYFRKYLSITERRIEAMYFLAKTLHYYHRFDEAIEVYSKFKKTFSDFPELEEVLGEMNESIDHEISRCNYGKIIILESTDAVIENLGPIINSEYSEYAPVIDHTESQLAFTRRSPQTRGGKLSSDGDYYEDIYIANISGGRLMGKEVNAENAISGYFSLLKRFKSSIPEEIGNNVNTKSHDAAIQFSNNDSTLYIYHDFDVWASDWEHLEWQKPHRKEKIHDLINSDSFEPSISLSKNEEVMFISSDREGGFGGLDLYMAIKNNNGTWSALKNLGPEINTMYDEDSPYIDPNNKTLYFSSKGHSSIGGYDIFKTHRDSGSWSPPQNIGFPINSAGDDIFYMMTPLFNRAYFASDKYGGYGKMDIYRITFADERTPLAEIKGFIKEGEQLIPAKAKLTVLNADNKTELYHVISDEKFGEYHLMFGHGSKYNIKVELEGFLPYQRQLYIPDALEYYQYYQEIHHKHIYDTLGNILGEIVLMHNIFDKEHGQGNLSKKDIEQLESEQFLSTVKFFISEDSVEVLIAESLINTTDVPNNSEISYYNNKRKDGASFKYGEADSINLAQNFANGKQNLFHTKNTLNLSSAELASAQINSEKTKLGTNNTLNQGYELIDNEKSKTELFEIQKTLARVRYSLSNLYDVLESPNLYSKQYKAAIEENLRLTAEAKEALITGSLILDKDPEHSVSARRSIQETKIFIVNTEQAIKAIEKIFSSKLEYSEIQLDSLNVMKELLAKTQASLMQTEVAFSQTPEADLSYEESFEKTKIQLLKTEELLLKVTQNIDSSEVLDYSIEDIQNQIIQTELSLLKTVQLGKLNTNDSLNAELLSTKVVLAEIESDILEINDIKSGYDVSDEELQMQIKKTQSLISEAVQNVTRTEHDMNLLSDLPLSNIDSILTLTIYFEFDMSSLDTKYIADIDKLIKYIAIHPEYRFCIEGHTDSKGSDTYNIQLSKHRANAVKNYLINRGVTSEIITKGIGETQPTAPNNMPDGKDNPNGRKLNRRVVIDFF
jgi:outer membrane protein OmpA-like peptidoglycan-associated protein